MTPIKHKRLGFVIHKPAFPLTAAVAIATHPRRCPTPRRMKGARRRRRRRKRSAPRPPPRPQTPQALLPGQIWATSSLRTYSLLPSSAWERWLLVPPSKCMRNAFPCHLPFNVHQSLDFFHLQLTHPPICFFMPNVCSWVRSWISARGWIKYCDLHVVCAAFLSLDCCDGNISLDGVLHHMRFPSSDGLIHRYESRTHFGNCVSAWQSLTHTLLRVHSILSPPSVRSVNLTRAERTGWFE